MGLKFSPALISVHHHTLLLATQQREGLKVFSTCETPQFYNSLVLIFQININVKLSIAGTSDGSPTFLFPGVKRATYESQLMRIYSKYCTAECNHYDVLSILLENIQFC